MSDPRLAISSADLRLAVSGARRVVKHGARGATQISTEEATAMAATISALIDFTAALEARVTELEKETTT